MPGAVTGMVDEKLNKTESPGLIEAKQVSARISELLSKRLTGNPLSGIVPTFFSQQENVAGLIAAELMQG